MKKPYFVMMYSQNGNIAMPIMDEELEEVFFWATEEEAKESMEKHAFAKSFGYEIFCMGEGAT